MPVWPALAGIYQKGKRYIAEFADIVFGAYAAGDRAAGQIIENNIRYIAELIRTAQKKYRAEKHVALAGGVFTCQPFLLEKLKKLLPDDFKLYIVTEPPVLGAVRIAGRELK